jgi:hypothetical protein
MAWVIIEGPENVTYPPSISSVSWRYRLQTRDGREMTTTFAIANITPDPAQQRELSEAVESRGRTVLLECLEAEGRPPSRIMVDSLGIHPRA